MSQVLFYILDEKSEPTSTGLEAHFAYASQIAAYYYRANKRVFIYTDNENDAFAIDEYLWQFDGDSFVPHNLLGEGPRFGAPVEISWQAPMHSRQVLINLSLTVPDFVRSFNQIIDFVPFEEQLKIQARKRYSTYKKMGLNLSTESVAIKATARVINNNKEE